MIARPARRLVPLVLAVSLAALYLARSRPSEAGTDEPTIPFQERKAGGDADKRYFLIGPRDKDHAPKDGYRLLVVLPGGDGGADFLTFVRRIAEEALPDGYLVAQPVAKAWDSKQAKELVWPTSKNRPAVAKFSTEEFVEAVVADVKKAHKVDPRYVFTLGWSSSGPPSYAESLRPKRAVTGSSVAMSVFFAGMYGPLSEAKGNAYYILHSPQDFIPIARAEGARDALKKAGARVEFATYEGGHGWHGDVFGEIRKGVEWLEAHHAEPRPALPAR